VIDADAQYRIQRERMVEQQLVPRGITDERVLDAMRTVPRHLFVEEALRSRAYGDHPLPIGAGQTISQPYIVALMTQALRLRGDEKVLEIGTGSGYQAAVLSRLCAKVFTIERLELLLARARRIFDRLHYHNIVSRLDDGTVGWPDEAPFQGILVTAASPGIPDPLLAQLDQGGRMVIPVGDQWSQELVLLHKHDEERIERRTIELVRFVSLVGKHGWAD